MIRIYYTLGMHHPPKSLVMIAKEYKDNAKECLEFRQTEGYKQVSTAMKIYIRVNVSAQCCTSLFDRASRT